MESSKYFVFFFLKNFLQNTFAFSAVFHILAPASRKEHLFYVRFGIVTITMADVVQLVRTSDCESECRGFKSLHSPHLLE